MIAPRSDTLMEEIPSYGTSGRAAQVRDSLAAQQNGASFFTYCSLAGIVLSFTPVSSSLKRRRKHKKVPHASGNAVGVVVPVTESTERWSEFQLEDGSIIKIRATVLEAIRMNNEYDAEGAPVYTVKSTNLLLVEPAENLCKPGSVVPAEADKTII